MNDKIEIREIIKNDNASISFIIKTVLKEFSGILEGTAYYDPETDAMFSAYKNINEVYFVALKNHKVIGGCGIKALKNANNNTCELQKMYLLSEARGFKIGKMLMHKCLTFAKAHYQYCYIETFDNMHIAMDLYQKNGFKKIVKSLGDTSHHTCNVWMLKKLN
jgi:putative acetyltransferase